MRPAGQISLLRDWEQLLSWSGWPTVVGKGWVNRGPGCILSYGSLGRKGSETPGLQNQLGKTSVGVERTRLIRATSLKKIFSPFLKSPWTFLAGQWLRLCTSIAGTAGTIPGQGVMTPQDARYSKKIKINKNRKLLSTLVETTGESQTKLNHCKYTT